MLSLAECESCNVAENISLLMDNLYRRLQVLVECEYCAYEVRISLVQDESTRMILLFEGILLWLSVNSCVVNSSQI